MSAAVATADLDRAAAAVAVAPARCGATRVVAVDGRSGAGKSTFARALAERLGADATLLQLEGVYPGWSGLEGGIALVASDVLVPLARGEAARAPQWDWARGTWGPALDVAAAPPVLVLEGVGAGALPIAPFLSVLVWLQAADAVRRDRALTRDGEAYRPYWDVWARQEAALLARDPIRSRADLVVEQR